MAASVTPGEAGLLLETNSLVSEWAREKQRRMILGETAINYQEFINRQQGEE